VIFSHICARQIILGSRPQKAKYDKNLQKNIAESRQIWTKYDIDNIDKGKCKKCKRQVTRNILSECNTEGMTGDSIEGY